METHRTLKDVFVALGFLACRVGPLNTNKIAQFDKEQRVIRTLRSALPVGPSFNERF